MEKYHLKYDILSKLQILLILFFGLIKYTLHNYIIAYLLNYKGSSPFLLFTQNISGVTASITWNQGDLLIKIYSLANVLLFIYSMSAFIHAYKILVLK